MLDDGLVFSEILVVINFQSDLLPVNIFVDWSEKLDQNDQIKWTNRSSINH